MPEHERIDFALTPDNPSFAKMTGEPTIMLLAPYEEFLIREMRRLSIRPQAVIEMLKIDPEGLTALTDPRKSVKPAKPVW